MAMTADAKFDLAVMSPGLAGEALEFLEKISTGAGILSAGLAVGWSPRKTREMTNDAAFAELMSEARELVTESIEEKVVEMARRGNIRAMELYLFCQAPERGWRPPTQRVAVTQNSHVKIEVVNAARQAIIDVLSSEGAEALQIGGALDAGDH